MMDKLRACIVANYYASASLLKVGEVKITFDWARIFDMAKLKIASQILEPCIWKHSHH